MEAKENHSFIKKDKLIAEEAREGKLKGGIGLKWEVMN
jgi:hypothetical protein